MVPTARVSHAGAACVTVALAAVPSVIALAQGRTVGFAAATVLGLMAGASVGWAVDDPAAEVLSPHPVSSPIRLVLRMLTVASAAIATLTVCVLAMVAGTGLPSRWPVLVPEIASAAAVALAVGLVAARRGERAAGPVAVTAGVLAVLVIGALAVRWPHVFPAMDGGPAHTRWWLVAAAGLVVAARAGRDPGRG